jgi:hypothetical protein
VNDEGETRGEMGLIRDLVEFRKEWTLLSLCGIDGGDGWCRERDRALLTRGVDEVVMEEVGN